MILPANRYGDPSNLVDGIRRRQCDGCVNELVVFFNHEKVRSCNKGKRHSDAGGERCKFYIKTVGGVKNGIK